MPQSQSVYLGFVLLLLATGCAPNQAPSDEVKDQATRISALETEFENVSNRLEAIGDSLNEVSEHLQGERMEGMDAQPFNIAVAQYVMDAARFHAIDEALTADQEIDPAHLPTLIRVNSVISSVAWPEDLAHSVEHFLGALEELRTAFESDDVSAATTLASEVHDLQHDLSGAIDAWLGGVGHEHEREGEAEG